MCDFVIIVFDILEGFLVRFDKLGRNKTRQVGTAAYSNILNKRTYLFDMLSFSLLNFSHASLTFIK